MSVFIPFDSGLFALFLHLLIAFYIHDECTSHNTHTYARTRMLFFFYNIKSKCFHNIQSVVARTYILSWLLHHMIEFSLLVLFSWDLHASHTPHSHYIQSNIHETYVRFFLFHLLFVFILFRIACNYGLKPVTIHNFFFIWLRWVSLFRETMHCSNELGDKRKPANRTTINHTTYACTHNELHNFDNSHIFRFAMNAKWSRWLFD